MMGNNVIKRWRTGMKPGSTLRDILFSILLVAVALPFAVSTTQAAPITPTSDFTISSDGSVVTHNTTGLIWRRCSEGQNWAKTHCSGTAKTYSWDQASALPAGNWRLPTIAELVTIIEFDKYQNTINTTVFPNTPSDQYWSSSPYMDNKDAAWNVSFIYGDTGATNKSNRLYVRMVRGGPLPVLDPSVLPAYTPTSDFTDHRNGTVTHNRTGLMWKRCAEGESWTGSACGGKAQSFAWSRYYNWEPYAGYYDWRVPSMSELLSIIEWGTVNAGPSNPSFNTAIFPGNNDYYWSSTVYGPKSDGAWVMLFWNAQNFGTYQSMPFHIRLVRGTRTFTPLPGAVSVQQSDCFFNWAESAYPSLFSPLGATSSFHDDYYYRYYASTNSYLGINESDNHVYYIGPLTNNALTDLGEGSGWLTQAECK